MRDSTQSYQTHIVSLEQRVKELEAKGQAIPRTLLDAAIAALKIGDTDKADEVLAEVELSAQDHIEAAAEAAYQRAKIAEEGIQYRKAFDHAMRASQLMPEEGRYLNLAGYIADTLGEYDKAIGYFEQALASALATFGEAHPNVAATHNNLGSAWKALGDYDKAIGYYELALASGLATFGKDHPQVATYRNNLGGAWESKGEYDKAIGYYELALATMKKVFGDNHPRTQTVQQNLERAKNEQ